jgi:sirohydrochlorin cobaltochelatase
MYDPVDELEGRALDRAVEACCTDDVCLKRRVWESGEAEEGGGGDEETNGEGRTIDVPPGDGEIPCREPCSLFIAAAREFALAEREDAEDEGEGRGRLRDEDSEHTTLTDTDRESLDAILAGLAGRENVEPVRPGEVSDPRNHYRARYLRAKLRDLEGGKPDTDDRARTAETAPNPGDGDR